MSIDIDLVQFHDVFFEESLEGLDTMEANLLSLDLGTPDAEMINVIFRAAHSIKGGAGTFGFHHIADFTHVLETLFDEVRDHRRAVSKDLVGIMLESVDCVRHMIAQSKNKANIDEARVSDLRERLQCLPDEQRNRTTWRVAFRPFAHLFKTGNDPCRIIRELESLGELKARVNKDKLPPLAELDPELSYLAWDIRLSAEVDRERIRELFEWVEDDCELQITLEDERSATADAPEIPHHTLAADVGQHIIGQETRSIRVNIDKVDNLVNLVGELVITQSMLSRFADADDVSPGDIEQIKKGIETLGRNTRDLQEQAMNIRMLPIDFVFQRLPRLVRDLCEALGKQAELKISGGGTEVDKTVLEKIADPLVHLVRNALDHGIEAPSVRAAAGKPQVGAIELKAFHESGNIVIRIRDDGAGLKTDQILAQARQRGIIKTDKTDDELSDTQIQDLIFQPGFTTATEVSDVSGRGVGMDVVRRNIIDLGGQISFHSTAGKGNEFIIRLPLTLAIVDGQLIRVGDDIFIIPLLSIVESIQINPDLTSRVAGKNEVYRYRDDYIPVIRLHELYGIDKARRNLADGLLIITDAGQRVGLFVDEVSGQQQVVIKSLKTNFRQVESIAGATILGDGAVAMILDLPGLIRHFNVVHGELRTTVSAEEGE